MRDTKPIDLPTLLDLTAGIVASAADVALLKHGGTGTSSSGLHYTFPIYFYNLKQSTVFEI
jgi:hypothetical protein